MKKELTATQVNDLGGFLDALTEACSEWGFEPFTWDKLQVSRFRENEPFAEIQLSGNDEDGYFYELVLG